MVNRGVLAKNYYIDPEAVAALGADIERVMTEADQAMEEASEIIAGIASLTERVPAEIRCSELLDLCGTAQAEIKSFDFLSYGKRVNQGLLNLIDHNQYITENFIRKMRANTERARGIGEEFRSLTDMITYSGGSVPMKGTAFSAVGNAEIEDTNGKDENTQRQENGKGTEETTAADMVGLDDVLLRAGAAEALEAGIEEVMIESGIIVLSNYMTDYGLGDELEINEFTEWISVRQPDLLQQLCAANLSSAEEAEQVIDKIFNEIAVAQNEENIDDYMEIYNKYYEMKMAIEILEEYLAASSDAELSNWTEIEEILRRDNPRLLINLYETQGEDGKAGVFAYLMREYKQSVDYIFEHISEEDVVSLEEMRDLPTPDLLARMIYQEYQNPNGGEQNKVLWATINRYFSEKNFTNNKECTIRNILLEGGYASIDCLTTNKYDAYHPDYDSDGWENAKLLAAILYSQIGENNSDKVDEVEVRNAILSSCDINGNNIDNTIGDCDSFRAEKDDDGNYYNDFYVMKPYNGG